MSIPKQTLRTILRIEHVPRHWADGGDRWTVCLWRRGAGEGPHRRVRLPFAVCPTEQGAELLVDAVRAYQEGSVAAGLGDPVDALAAAYAAPDEKKEA